MDKTLKCVDSELYAAIQLTSKNLCSCISKDQATKSERETKGSTTRAQQLLGWPTVIKNQT